MISREQADNIRRLILEIVLKAWKNHEIDRAELDAIQEYMVTCETALFAYHDLKRILTKMLPDAFVFHDDLQEATHDDLRSRKV